MAVKVAINGFGRIGMLAAKIISQREDLELVAINSTAEAKMTEYLLKYDSVHGRFDDVRVENEYLYIKDEKAKIFSTRNIDELDFAGCNVDVVLECTGQFLTTAKAEAYLGGSVKKVVMSAPAKDDTPTFVIGINENEYAGQAIVSNASCTTNGLAPLVKVLQDAFGIEEGLMTTIHSYTNDQNILDARHSKDVRRARAAAVSMIPTSTGAAKAIGLVIPELKGKLSGYAVRVPTPDVSLVDLTVNLKKEATKEEVNAAFLKASEEGTLKGLLEIDNDKCVSQDFVGSKYSSTYIPDLTQVVGKMVKTAAWYDNEWGYTERLCDMCAFICSK
jgi:glyceraldehyde 3-phosphate dehydrogenase